MKPKISVIIPCYNSENFITRCAQSLINQTIGIENLELIFINDGSTDNTLIKLNELETLFPNNIMVIDLGENLKQGTARNIGIQYANADYIGFVDSDDWIEESMYEKLYMIMQQYNCDIVGCCLMVDLDWIYVKFLDTKRLSFFAQQPFMDCSTSQVDCQRISSL